MDLDINALRSTLNAVLDRPSEDPISRPASPSLASTSSEALQYHSAVYRKPLTEEEQTRRNEKSERLRTLFWGDKQTRRAGDEQFERERKALQNLGMRGWGTCEAYEKDASRLAAHRTAEDGSRNISAEGYAPTWTENDQRVLEFQRQKEDYVQLAEILSVFLVGDEECESEQVLRYRLRNLKTLLRLYDSQLHESFRRVQEDADKRKQRIQSPTENGVNDHESEVQGICQNALGGTEQKDRPEANEPLGLVDSSKAAKATGRKRMGPRRRPNIPQEASSGDLPLASGLDAAESRPLPDRVTPRRSQRIQPSIPSLAKDPTKTASADPTKHAVRSKSERNVGGKLKTRSSAKPQGVSKRQPAKITRGKARKR